MGRNHIEGPDYVAVDDLLNVPLPLELFPNVLGRDDFYRYHPARDHAHPVRVRIVRVQYVDVMLSNELRHEARRFYKRLAPAPWNLDQSETLPLCCFAKGRL